MTDDMRAVARFCGWRVDAEEEDDLLERMETVLSALVQQLGEVRGLDVERWAPSGLGEVRGHAPHL